MTEKGMALEPILEQMSAFSMKYFPKEIFKDGKARSYDEIYGHAKKPVERENYRNLRK
jgi:hypothetical protein